MTMLTGLPSDLCACVRKGCWQEFDAPGYNRCSWADPTCMAGCNRHDVFAGVKTQPEPNNDVTEVNGVRILEGKYAISEEGKILSPSGQNMLQLKAELAARNLSTEGKREELKRRVMVGLPKNCCCLHFA